MPPAISLTDAATGKRVRVAAFRPGGALVPVPQPQPILGYCYTTEHNWTVYTWPARCGPNCTRPCSSATRVLLVAELPAGSQETTLPDHRREFTLQQAA